MQGLIQRNLEHTIRSKLSTMPVVAIIGPRQCGKSTLAKMIVNDMPNHVFLDLEKPSHLSRLRDPEAYLDSHREKLVCIDEIQNMPNLFPLLRTLVDENNRNGQFLILGSASPDLLRQSSESLAGRIAYLELTPFSYAEAKANLVDFWLRGGFPRSYLAEDEIESFEWRQQFIQTFLQRDLHNLGFQIPAPTLFRLWRMLAHVQGQVLNASKLGASLGVSHHTLRRYIEILEQTFMLRVLPPFEFNLKKRLIKSPKVYIRDTGILHALLSLESPDDLYSHPEYGSSWETLVIEQLVPGLPRWENFFYRTASGNEIDLILQKGRRRVAIEAKASRAPLVGKGFRQALQDLEITEAWIAAPVDEVYPYGDNIMVGSPNEIIKQLQA